MTLQQHRKAQGITQEKLAQTIGVTKQTIVRYENGERFPSRDLMLRISDVLNLTPEQGWQCFIERR